MSTAPKAFAWRRIQKTQTPLCVFPSSSTGSLGFCYSVSQSIGSGHGWSFFGNFRRPTARHSSTASIMEALLASELSADTLAALQAHLQAQQQESDAQVAEDFRLSQLYRIVVSGSVTIA